MITEDAILDSLRARAGIDAAQTGEASLRKAIRRAIERCAEPHRFLDGANPEWAALLEEALVPETWFFRNIEAFEALARWVTETWMPAHPGARLRVLSLPCATGEEPYSLAMCLLEAGLAPEQFEIRAGDISRDSLAKAKAGAYRKNSFRQGFDENRFGKYFEDAGDGVRLVNGDVRDLVEFAPMNLAVPSAPFPPSDVIFCRNALIYFAPETQRETVERLSAALADDGILFLGPVEPPIALECGFVSSEIPMAFACLKRPAGANGSPKPQLPAARRPKRAAPPQPRKPATAPRAARAPKAEPREAPGDSLEAARALADAGDVRAAAAMLDRVAASSAPSPELFCLQGVVCGALGCGDLAEAHYRKALYLDPSHYEAVVQLALHLELEGRGGAAAGLRRRAEKLSAP